MLPAGFRAVALVSLLIFPFCQAKQRCVWAIGKLICKQDPTAVSSIPVKLYDWDGGTFLDPDDRMGFDVTDESGAFRVTGCGSDLFPWNDPDPYLYVEHSCGGSETVYETGVNKVFLPDNWEIGDIELD